MDFYNEIAQSNALRASRDRIVAMVWAQPELFDELITLALKPEDPFHYKACWITELALEKRMHVLEPYTEKLGETLKHYTHEGAKRSISKIVLEYIRYKKNNLPPVLTNQCIEACFDWLIHDDKVATKAYAMRALWELGQKLDWILPELKDIITKDFSFHSAGYKAAAKDVLRNL